MILTANYYGIQSQYVQEYPGVPTLDLLIEGKYLIASFIPDADYPKSAHHLGAMGDVDIIQFTTDLDVIINPAVNVTGHGQSDKIVNKGGNNYRVYELYGYGSPDILFAGMMVRTTGQDWFAFTSRPLIPTVIDYRSHYNRIDPITKLIEPFPLVGIKTEVLSRVVRIGQNSYILELTLWRTSE